MSDFNLKKIKFSGKVLSRKEQTTIIGGLRQLRKNPGKRKNVSPKTFLMVKGVFLLDVINVGPTLGMIDKVF